MSTTFADPQSLTHDQLEAGTVFAPRFDASGLICDQDALVLKVEQTGRGAACHTGRRSCFYRRVSDSGGLEDAGVPRLFDPKDVYTQ